MKARADHAEQASADAAAWHARLGGDDVDWDALTVWLEADPQHRAAFDEVALIDRAIDVHCAALRRIDDPVAAPRIPRRRWAIGAVAAALALAVGIPALVPARADAVYATRAGETRRVAFANGVSVELAPGSRLVARNGDANRVEVAAGEIYFTVAHDPARTLSVAAGDYVVTDIGTRFAINRTGRTVVVAVDHGRVSVAAPTFAPAAVAAGQQFVGDAGDARVERIDAATVASWRRGRLTYANAPVAVVAADIGRYLDKSVTVDPAIEGRRFSGVLVVGDRSRLLPDLAALLDTSYRVDGDRIRLGARRR